METVQCMICKRKFDSESAYNHSQETGHNKWKLLIPKNKEKGGR